MHSLEPPLEDEANSSLPSRGHLTKRKLCTLRPAAALLRAPGRLDECIVLIWSDRVNLRDLWVVVVVAFVVFRGQSEQQPGQFYATIDQSDIRGSKPHNLDPSGAASDCYRESG